MKVSALSMYSRWQQYAVSWLWGSTCIAELHLAARRQRGDVMWKQRSSATIGRWSVALSNTLALCEALFGGRRKPCPKLNAYSLSVLAWPGSPWPFR
jgi:hypothetical protein